MSKNNKRCWQPGCHEKGIKCYGIPYRGENGEWQEDIERYCPQHAPDHGYCYGCGNCWVTDRFMFGPYAGLCDNCKDEAEIEDYEYDDELEFYFDEY